jgi:glycerophosphoryl diester phosphodiesterase
MSFYLDRPIAHRGFHDEEIPENSMAAFEKAMELGYSIELDIHLSKDGIPVVFHDESLERLTGSKGKVSQYILSSLKKLRLDETDQEIPTLKEVLELVDGKVPLVIELKVNHHDGIIESEVMKTLYGYEGDYAIQSFNPLTLKWLREHYPNTVLGLLTTSDFSDTELGKGKQKVLQYMAFAPVIRPDYVGLDYKTFNIAQYYLIKFMTHGKIVFWTIDSLELYEECIELCDNVIFEGFIPPESE